MVQCVFIICLFILIRIYVRDEWRCSPFFLFFFYSSFGFCSCSLCANVTSKWNCVRRSWVSTSKKESQKKKNTEWLLLLLSSPPTFMRFVYYNTERAFSTAKCRQHGDCHCSSCRPPNSHCVSAQLPCGATAIYSWTTNLSRTVTLTYYGRHKSAHLFWR